MRDATRRAVVLGLAGLLALPRPALAQDPRAPEGPLAVEVPQGPAPEGPAPVPAGTVPAGRSEAPGPAEQVPADRPEGAGAPLQRPPPEAAAEEVGVAVGLGPSAPGSKAEKQVVDALERAALASSAPRTRVRRLRAGTGDGRAICRERRDQLVILVEYLPDRADPVLLTQDCGLDRGLGIRPAAAAGEPELVAALWSEHRELVQQGVRERRVRLSPKVRTGLIAGGAILAVGVAVGLVIFSSLRRETVVLTVGP